MEQTENSRKAYMDILNIAACICVVGIHCNSAFNVFENSARWLLSPFLNAVYYWANGMFFMLSGANLLNYREKYNTKTFFQKRVTRVCIPFLFWSMFALLLQSVTGGIELNGWRDALNRMLTNGCIYGGIYWFFYVIIYIYGSRLFP